MTEIRTPSQNSTSNPAAFPTPSRRARAAAHLRAARALLAYVCRTLPAGQRGHDLYGRRSHLLLPP